MKRSILILSILLIPLNSQAESATFCVGGLAGHVAYEMEGNKFEKDYFDSPIVIQITDNRVSVMGWGPVDCKLLSISVIVCHEGDTIETYSISTNNTVYYTKSRVNTPMAQVKALVGKLVEC